MDDRLNITSCWKVQQNSCAVHAGIVMMKSTTDTCSRMPFAPCQEVCRQIVVDIPVSHSSLSVLKRYCGNMAGFWKENMLSFAWKYICFSFEFHRWVLLWEDPHRLLLLHLKVVLVSPPFVSCTRGSA